MPDPALIFEGDPKKPGTHVLLIGIGTYPYLLGGPDQRPEIADGMGQLLTPSPTVRALADWFLDTFENPDHPLASLAMLISETAPAAYEHPKMNRGDGLLPRGTADDVVSAIRAWVGRASAVPDSQTVFYFCGHGVFSTSQALLCRDFGREPEDRFDGAINFGAFHNVMQSRIPARQLFFADSCRSPSAIRDALVAMPSPGRAPLSVQGVAAYSRQSVCFASSDLKPSYGKTDGISMYGEAVLKALNGGGAQSDLSMWVGTNGIHSAISTYTARIAAEHGLEQEPDRSKSARFKLHKPSSISVPVYLTCDPEDGISFPFDLTVKCSRGTIANFSHDGDSKGAQIAINLSPDRYDLQASFQAGGRYTKGEGEVFAMPPESLVSLSVT